MRHRRSVSFTGIRVALLTAWLLLGSPLLHAEALDPAMFQRVRTLVVQLSDPNPKVRATADIYLRNLPLSALTEVQQILADGDSLDPETRLRLSAFGKSLATLAARARKQQALAQWDSRTALETYDKLGHKASRWDAAAKEAIALAAQWIWTNQESPKMRAAFSTAEKAGCFDPLFLAFLSRLGKPLHLREQRQRLIDLNDIVQQIQGLPPERRLMILAYAYQAFADMPGVAPVDLMGLESRIQPAAVRALDDLGKAPHQVPPAFIYRMAMLLCDAQQRLNDDSPLKLQVVGQPFDQELASALEKALPNSPYSLIFKGRWHCRRASWEVFRRGGRLAADIPLHIQKAEEYIQKAYDMDPSDPTGPTEVLSIEAGGSPWQESMEKWFGRAMEADPDNYLACHRKLVYLYYTYMNKPSNAPDNEVIAFARQCRQTENWRGRLPFALIEAHLAYSHNPVEEEGHLQQPAVWEDISSVYRRYLELYPDDSHVRSEYARIATRCYHWDEAHRQFLVLGEKAEVQVFGSLASLNYFRKKAARLGQSSTQPAAQAVP